MASSASLEGCGFELRSARLALWALGSALGRSGLHTRLFSHLELSLGGLCWGRWQAGAAVLPRARGAGVMLVTQLPS